MSGTVVETIVTNEDPTVLKELYLNTPYAASGIVVQYKFKIGELEVICSSPEGPTSFIARYADTVADIEAEWQRSGQIFGRRRGRPEAWELTFRYPGHHFIRFDLPDVDVQTGIDPDKRGPHMKGRGKLSLDDGHLHVELTDGLLVAEDPPELLTLTEAEEFLFDAARRDLLESRISFELDRTYPTFGTSFFGDGGTWEWRFDREGGFSLFVDGVEVYAGGPYYSDWSDSISRPSEWEDLPPGLEARIGWIYDGDEDDEDDD